MEDFTSIGLNRTPTEAGFPDGGDSMMTVTLSDVACRGLGLWRFVVAGLGSRTLSRVVAAPRQQRNTIVEFRLCNLGQARPALFAGDRSENCSDGGNPVDRNERAKTYLRRIVALTEATQAGNGYELDVGTTRFHVRDKYVRRIRDATDPKCGYEETCFFSAYHQIPKCEQIAAGLLQLRNNPALFDRWAAQNGAFKADGQAFSPSE